MSKELECLENIGNWELTNSCMEKVNESDEFAIIKQALQRLEAIDNSNPNEALELVKRTCELYVDSLKLRDLIGYDIIEKQINEALDTIKQALLKAQEPKQYLKWEDLDKFEEQKNFFGLLNGNKYTLWWYRDSRNKYVMINLNKINIVTLCDMFKQDIDFFNDLHLERVE